ncbi:MAG: mono/diheme cytochrome c family protein [Mariniblastus sp.]|jgi:mono/diheme cytochrome c family protein
MDRLRIEKTMIEKMIEVKLGRRFFRRGLFSAIALLVLLGTLSEQAIGQAPTPRQKQSVKQIKTNIDRAGKQFKAKKFAAAAKYVNEATKQATVLAASASPELMELIKPEFERLSKAHELLTKEGQKLEALGALPAPMTGDGEAVSFTKSVAPILVAKCGNCHVARNRGDFSAATFEALDQSTMLAYGLPDDARLIQVIESGEMPKGGLKVDEAELKILRAWMKQGAKFDGESVKQSLNDFVTAPTPPARNRERMKPRVPTGKETVSFGLDVAPILLENCARCHINNNPRGNFSMANFRDILQGGDGGNPILPGEAAKSPIVMRLKGEGAEVMPPTGKLDDKLIDIVIKWIEEGAAFDGGDERLGTLVVAAKVKADSQTHEELLADRNALATKTWKLVMDGVQSQAIPSKNFLVTGSTSESRLTDVSRLCEKLAPKIASALRADSKKPLVKGNLSLFVFDKRYDFSEFGKMIEGRDFPKEVSGHWGYTTIDAYATVLMTRNKTAEDIQTSLVHQIAAIHAANLAPDTPRWFADGLGLWTARKILPKEDSMKSLDSRAAAAAASMTKPDDFVQNRMPSDQAGLVGYLFVKELKSNSGSYARLMKLLAAGQTFEKSFAEVYGGSPSVMLGQKEPRR